MKYVIALLGVVLAIIGLTVEDVFANFPALVAGTVALVTFIKASDKVQGKLAFVVSWGVGIALTLLGYFGALGFLAELVLWQTLLVAAGVSASANGFYKMVVVILEALGIIKK